MNHAPPRSLLTRILSIGICLATLLLAPRTSADVFRPAYLELRETEPDRYEVLWKVPAKSARVALAVEVDFPEGTRVLGTPRHTFTGTHSVRDYRIHRAGGLIGESIRIEDHATDAADVIARFERADGTTQVERLGRECPSFTLEASKAFGEVALSYFVLGVEHILGGLDHLLFVFALLLIVREGRRLVTTITAFSLAHSVTLVAATLGWVKVPGPPVEVVIALSIVFVTAEVVHQQRGHEGWTARAPWTVAFGFGLLHGLGFAGALEEVGLPEAALPLALLTFNLGVEVGQLLVVGMVLLSTAFSVRCARRVPALTPWPRRFERFAPYVMGTASFWS